MSNLQQAILQLENLSNLEISYLSSLATSRIKPPPSDKSIFLDLPRELRDRVYYFATVNFWNSMSPHHRVLRRRSKAGRLARGLSLTMVSKQIGSEFGGVVYGPEMIRCCYKESPSMSDVVPKPRPVDMSMAMMKSILQSKRMFKGSAGFILGGSKGFSVTADASEEFEFFRVIEDARGEARFVGFMELLVFQSEPNEYSYDLGLVFGARNKHQKADRHRVQAWVTSQRYVHTVSQMESSEAEISLAYSLHAERNRGRGNYRLQEMT